MEKILLTIDGNKISANAIDFACYLGRVMKSNITGVVLENLPAERMTVIRHGYDATYIESTVNEDSPEHIGKTKRIERSIAFFKEACIKRQVNCTIYRDTEVPVTEMIAESRFADLIVIDAQTSFDEKYEGCPTVFAKQLLEHSECPVIVAPESFDALDEIIFCYDGSASAMFSIKQFDYLFPSLRCKQMMVLEVVSESHDTTQEINKIKEWMSQRYTSVQYEVLHGMAEDELFGYLLPRKNALIVLGAYGRSNISRFFKSSVANRILKTINLPVFIAHK